MLDGKVRQEMILVCNAYRSEIFVIRHRFSLVAFRRRDVQHPNECYSRFDASIALPSERSETGRTVDAVDSCVSGVSRHADGRRSALWPISIIEKNLRFVDVRRAQTDRRIAQRRRGDVVPRQGLADLQSRRSGTRAIPSLHLLSVQFVFASRSLGSGANVERSRPTSKCERKRCCSATNGSRRSRSTKWSQFGSEERCVDNAQGTGK